MTPENYDPNLPPAGQQPTISPYGFILSPEKDMAKKSPLGLNDPFMRKLVFGVGGLVVLVILVLVLVSVFSGSKSDVQKLVELTQSQQEIIRLSSATTSKLSSQELKNATVNTQATLTTDQTALLAITLKAGKKSDPKILAAKLDAAADQQITVAESTNTIDTVYRQILAAQLDAYQQALKAAYNSDFSPETKKLLQKQFNHTVLLEEQLTASQ